jgi:predicted neutral ceramidase superfamily lipid hydrolase
MRWFEAMKNHADERIISVQNKLYKETYIIVVSICIISLIVKSFMYDSGLKPIAVELTILLASSLYYGFRSVQLGLYSDEVEVHDQRNTTFTKSVKQLVWGGALGVAFAVFLGVRSALVYGEGTAQSLWYLLSRSSFTSRSGLFFWGELTR